MLLTRGVVFGLRAAMKMTAVLVEARCPDCGEIINLGAEPRLGQVVTCRGCKQDFEVISLDPPKLDWGYDGVEDNWTVMDWGFTGTFPGIWWGY